MTTKDTYLTIKDKSKGLYKEKGSRFIAFAYPVNTKEEVLKILEELHKEYHDARHYCYAYRLGAYKENYRVNDDGEPTNSAGPPVFGQIRAKNLTNIVVFVIRYFGGKLLGVGGLINAYKTAAADALSNAKIIKKTVGSVYDLTFDYPVLNDIMRLVERENLTIIKQEFKEKCKVRIKVRLSKSKAFEKRLNRSPEVLLNHIGNEE